MADTPSQPPLIEYAQPAPRLPVWLRIGLVCGPAVRVAGVALSFGLAIAQQGWSGRIMGNALVGLLAVAFSTRFVYGSVIQKKETLLRSLGVLFLLLGATMAIAVAAVSMGGLPGHAIEVACVLLPLATGWFYSGWAYLMYYWQVRYARLSTWRSSDTDAPRAR